MIEVVKRIIYNVLAAIYEPLGFAIVLAVLFMFFYMGAREHGWKAMVQRWVKMFKEEEKFRRVNILAR